MSLVGMNRQSDRQRGVPCRILIVQGSEKPEVGDVLYLHDAATGFSRKDCLRWCVVTAVIGRNVRVAGRSSTRTDGVPVPQSAMAAFDRDGWVLRPPVRISLIAANAARNVGKLPEPYLTQVLFFVDEEMP